jgi:chromosome segregation ATPase
MGDAGEGLIDADSRIQERMDELARERAERRAEVVRDPDAIREYESLRLARTELQRQLEATTNDRRRAQLQQAIGDLDHRMEGLKKSIK